MFLKYDNSAMKILTLFSIIKYKVFKVILNITIHYSKMSGVHMKKSGYNFPSWYFTSVEKIVGLRYHRIFYTGVISKFQQKWVSKGSVIMCMPRIGMVIAIWEKLLFKLRVSFDVLVSR